MPNTNFQLLSEPGLFPIAGASVWDYDTSGDPTLSGTTDSAGYYQAAAPNTELKLRFLAYGHVPYDFSRNAIFTGSQIVMQRNHPASFSGFLAGSTTALWKGKSSGKFYQFTALGFFRFEKDYDTLLETEFALYHLLENFGWPPAGPVVKPVSTPPTIPPTPKPPRPNLEWSFLETGSASFPTPGTWTIDPVNNYRAFRFPAPGKMIGKFSLAGDQTEDFELVN